MLFFNIIILQFHIFVNYQWKNKTNLQTSLGNILRTHPQALQNYVDVLFRKFLTEHFYPELMKKQEQLNVCIPPQTVVNAINNVLQEEINEGVLKEEKRPIIIIQSKTEIIKIMKKHEKTR